MGNSFPGNEKYFDEVAELYDRMRPTYVTSLYKRIFAYAPIEETSSVLEIGIGTGQATAPVLATNCSLLAVEPGKNLATYAAHRFRSYKKFSIVNTAFEDYIGQENSFDLIYSATAFHWVVEEIGYPLVYKLLKSGGVFARFANHPSKDKGKEELSLALQRLYAIYMPNSKPEEERDLSTEARDRAQIATKYGFVDTTYELFHRQRTFSPEEYVALLDTYSDHRALEQSVRQEFYAKVKEEIIKAGGSVTIYDIIDLELARKPR